MLVGSFALFGDSEDEPIDEIVVTAPRPGSQQSPPPRRLPGSSTLTQTEATPSFAEEEAGNRRQQDEEEEEEEEEQEEEFDCWQELTGHVGSITRPAGLFGAPRSYGGHKGIDIAAPRGTPVYTPVSGTAVLVVSGYKPDGDSVPAAGNHVVIHTADHAQHHFYHLEKASVSDKAKVQAGQQIGTVNDTGDSSRDHLHYHHRDSSGTLRDPTEVYPCES